MDKIDQLAEWCRRTFWRKRDHVAESTGTREAGLPVVLNSLGKLAISLLTPIVGNLTITGILTVTSDFIAGSSTFLTGVYGAARAQIEKASNGTLLLTRTSNDTGGPTLEFLKRRNAWGVVNNGDRIGSIGFSAADSVDAAVVAQIAVEVDGAPGSNDMPGRIIFYCTADGTQTLQDVLTLFANKLARMHGGAEVWGTLTLGEPGAAGAARQTITTPGGSSVVNSGHGREIELRGGTSDNTAGKHGGHLVFQGGYPTAPATLYGDLYFQPDGGKSYFGAGGFGDWTNLTYGSGWGDYNAASWQRGQYRKIGDLVQLRGLVARLSGVGTTIATLPGGHAPPVQILNQVNGTDAHARVDITAGGSLVLAAGTPTYISLNDIPPFSVV